MHDIWVGLFRVLIEGAVWGLSQAGVEALASAERDPLGAELRQLGILLAEYGLGLWVREPAEEALRALMAESVVTAPELVLRHIREPLSALIADDFFNHGDTVLVDCIDGVFTVGRAV